MKKVDYFIIGLISTLIIIFYLLFWYHFFNPDFGADQRLYWNQGYFLFNDFNFLLNPAFGLYESFIPIVIAALLHLFGESYIPIIVYNIIIYFLLIVVSYFFSRDIFNSRFWAIVLVLLLLTNNVFVQFAFLVSREISTVTFLLLFCTFSYLYVKTRKIKWFLLFNIIGVFAFFNDNRYLLHLILLGGMWIVYILKTDKNFKPVIFSILLIIFMVIPWSYRNYVVNGYFFPLSGVRLSLYLNFIPGNNVLGIDKTKLVLWTGNADRAGMAGDSSLLNLMPLPIETGYASSPGYHQKVSEQEYNKLRDQKSKKWLVTKINYLTSFWAVAQFRYKIGPGSDDRISPAWSLYRNFNEIIHTGLLIPFFILGTWFAIKRKKKIIIVLIALLIFHTLMHVISGAHLIRYRYHIMPLFTIVSVYGLMLVLTPLLRRIKLFNSF